MPDRDAADPASRLPASRLPASRLIEDRARIIGALAASAGWEAGCLGAGAGLRDGELRPMILGDAGRLGLPPNLPARLIDLSILAAPFAAALGATPDWLAQVDVLPIRPPGLSAAPDDAIATPNPGRVGCGVAWAAGSGFLTAGHVAPSGAVAGPAGTLGTVLWQNDPSGGGAGGSPEADIAVVELDPGRSWTASSVVAASVSAATAVTIPCTGNSGSVMGYVSWYYIPSANGIWGDSYFTTTAITAGGDSGGTAVDSSGAVVGHVVATSPGCMSFLQDVNYQLGIALRHVSGLTVV